MKRIVIHSQDKLRFILLADIVYCQADNCYTSLHLVTGEELIVCKPLKKVTAELSSVSFIRVNQSFLVNKDFISSIDKKNKNVELMNKKTLPFSITLKELITLTCEPNDALVSKV